MARPAAQHNFHIFPDSRRFRGLTGRGGVRRCRPFKTLLFKERFVDGALNRGRVDDRSALDENFVLGRARAQALETFFQGDRHEPVRNRRHVPDRGLGGFVLGSVVAAQTGGAFPALIVFFDRRGRRGSGRFGVGRGFGGGFGRGLRGFRGRLRRRCCGFRLRNRRRFGRLRRRGVGVRAHDGFIRSRFGLGRILRGRRRRGGFFLPGIGRGLGHERARRRGFLPLEKRRQRDPAVR